MLLLDRLRKLAFGLSITGVMLGAGCGADAADEPLQMMMQPSAVAGTANVGAAGANPIAISGAAGSSAHAQTGQAGRASAGTPMPDAPTMIVGVAGAAGNSAAAGMGAAGAAVGGSAGMSAAAGAGGGAAEPTGDDECGADAQEVMGNPRASGNGNTNLQLSGEAEFLVAKSTLIVPAEPSPTRGTLFLWPGLQALRSDSTVGYGVLQPVLTWGSSCAPGSLTGTDGWWISAQYVGTPPGSFSVTCKGGKVMKVEIGDKLDIVMELKGTNWTQTVTNQRNGESVDFTHDLKGQKQQWLLHQIEQPTMVKPSEDVIFTNVVAKLSESQPKACAPNARGMNDYFSPPRASADGKTCCIDKIILRSSGVAKSSPDEP